MKLFVPQDSRIRRFIEGFIDRLYFLSKWWQFWVDSVDFLEFLCRFWFSSSYFPSISHLFRIQLFLYQAFSRLLRDVLSWIRAWFHQIRPQMMNKCWNFWTGRVDRIPSKTEWIISTSWMAVLYVLSLIESKLDSRTDRNLFISPITKLLLTVRFYVLGTMLISTGDFAGVSKSSASYIVEEVSFKPHGWSSIR